MVYLVLDDELNLKAFKNKESAERCAKEGGNLLGEVQSVKVFERYRSKK